MEYDLQCTKPVGVIIWLPVEPDFPKIRAQIALSSGSTH